MRMTGKLANSLFGCFVALAISANGGYPEKGLSEKQLELVNTYARNKFLEVTDEWEVLTGEAWEIDEEELKEFGNN